MKQYVCLAVLFSTMVGCATTEDSGDGSGAAPVAPSQLAAAVVGGGAHLTWKDNSADEEHFMVERMVHGAGNYAEVATVPFDTGQYHDTNVTAGTTYMYRVTAMNAAGEAISNEVSIQIP